MFALGFAAAALIAGAFFVVVAFLAAGFFAGAFLVAAAVFGAALAGAFVVLALVAAGALAGGAAAGAAAGVLLGPASLTVPDGPVGDDEVSWMSRNDDRYARRERWRRQGRYVVLDGAIAGATRRVASCCDRWEERTLWAREDTAV